MLKYLRGGLKEGKYNQAHFLLCYTRINFIYIGPPGKNQTLRRINNNVSRGLASHLLYV